MMVVDYIMSHNVYKDHKLDYLKYVMGKGVVHYHVGDGSVEHYLNWQKENTLESLLCE